MKKLISILLALIMAFGTGAVAFAENQTSVPEGYIGIYTAEDLNNIRNNLSGKYILMNDIDLSVYENWEPIGDMENPFTGEIDGNNFSAKNLSLKIDINSEEMITLGLLGVTKSASLSKININNIKIDINYPHNSTFFAGGLTAYCFDSKIELCKVQGEISIVSGGNIYVGGIVGYINDINASTEVNKCVSNVEINVVGENKDFWQPEVAQYTNVGGIVGYSSLAKNIYKCVNKGNITVNSINIGAAGSIAGKCDADVIVKCKNSGEVIILGTCELNETTNSPTLWENILFFFVSLFNKIINVFK